MGDKDKQEKSGEACLVGAGVELSCAGIAGESLGENSLYLHGMPYLIALEAQTHVPTILWKGDGVDALQAKQHEKFSHDNLFHTVLGLMGVQTTVYDPELDIMSTRTD